VKSDQSNSGRRRLRSTKQLTSTSFFVTHNSSLPVPSPLYTPSSPSNHPQTCSRGALSPICDLSELQWAFTAVANSRCSGIARTLGRSVLSARPQVTRRAFEPLRKQAIPAVTARFASSDVKTGKIHQVIGAVVDGMKNPLRIEWSYIGAPDKLNLLSHLKICC
jgi:hypothetical protein